MYEKEPEALAREKEKTYLTRLKGQLIRSFEGLISFCGDVVMFLVAILPALLMLAILGFIAYNVYRRFFKKKNGLLAKKQIGDRSLESGVPKDESEI